MQAHEDLVVLRYSSEGLPTKQVLAEMAEQFKDPKYRHAIKHNEREVGFGVLISSELADQLARFFEDMANAIPDE